MAITLAPIIQLNAANNVPTSQTATAGGGMSATQITSAAAGQWMPELVALETGTVDGGPGNTVYQYQLAYACNVGTASWFNGLFYVLNALIYPTTAGIINLVSSSAADTGLFVRVIGVCAGLILIRDIALNGTNVVSGTDTWTRIERLELRNSTTGALAVGVGTVTASIGSSTPQTIGCIPAPVSNGSGGFINLSYASSEYKYFVAAALGDQATSANSQTDPTGGGTFVIPNSPSNALALPGTLTAPGSGITTDRCGIYCLQTLQPGVPSVNPLIRGNVLSGNS